LKLIVVVVVVVALFKIKQKYQKIITKMTKSISDYYNEKNVLVTGATGFVGKLLIEKLLSTCSSMRTVYCLIREKNGHSANERLNEITSCKVFDKLRKREPNFRDRLQAIAGNILDVDLGMSQKDLKMLEQNINVVFHLAGTVDLDQDLK
jgi:alcohol-forming fatty acyl-CoA reductase